MAYDQKAFEGRSDEVVEWLQKELARIRTGRATPELLESVRVASYGAQVPLVNVGTVSIEDPKTVRISVWDNDQIAAVERAILDADLGLSVVSDEKGVRAIFPELTGERRGELLKLAKGKMEEARVSIRSARDEAIKQLDKAGLSDDGKFAAKEQLQKRVDAANKAIEDLFEQKEREIRQ
jgi:ribosome recycling factor